MKSAELPACHLARPSDEPVDTAALAAREADRFAQAMVARATLGISPAAIALAFDDWLLHLATSPGKHVELARKFARKCLRYAWFLERAVHGGAVAPCIDPLPQDKRFSTDAWQHWPFNAIYQAFLLQQQWWHNATTDVHGVTPQHEQVVTFCVRQMLDTWAPSNMPAMNPEVLAATKASGGLNFVRGAQNFAEDTRRALLGEPPAGSAAFVPGVQVAVTPGKVVLRNALIELIQYEPRTDSVHPEPILIVPAWIMKFYILDLSPANSLVRYLVERGHTVFMISWKNPAPADRDVSMDDYLRLGIREALGAIGKITPGQKVHATGYCLGGSLLAIAAAAMARDADDRLASITLLAAQVDFEEAGELTLFINHSQVSLLQDMMAAQGFLDTRQMAGAFQLLRSNDLIWSRRVSDYLLGERPVTTDLMAWNADATRMPYRMHSEYLQHLFLENDLAEGRYQVDGRAVSLLDIAGPVFAVGTTRDHVAPWRSVYKLHLVTETDLTFVLASGGHNVGVVNPPGGKAPSSYQIATHVRGDRHLDPDTWVQRASAQAGSWWPAWQAWIAARSGPQVAPPMLGNPAHGLPPLCNAPGEYVFQR
ncbi:MAG: polyhydroxyalkanoic acid synthase [Paucibacter sp.]|nr:polyhydroxyalkanoic acid synthase [Roseateles sp.]